MPVDMAALAADLAAESAVTRALVAGLDEGVGSGWRTPTPAAGWDIADQISHLAYFDEVAVKSAVRPDEFRAELAAGLDHLDPDLLASRYRVPMSSSQEVRLRSAGKFIAGYLSGRARRGRGSE